VDIRRATDAFERLLLEESKQLGLERRNHLADLVEEHRSTVGRFEQPPLLDPRVGERAPLVPEELALEKRLGQRRAGDVHERTGRPVTRIVKHLRDEVLARPALSGQQDGGRRARRYFGDQVP
jgi:hypothetical protein